MSVAVSVQWEALGPVRPRGSAVRKWLGPAPPAPSSAPHGLGGVRFPCLSPHRMAVKVALGHVCERALQAQQRAIHVCVCVCVCVCVYLCVWCVWMRVSACMRRVLVGVYTYAGVRARIHTQVPVFSRSAQAGPGVFEAPTARPRLSSLRPIPAGETGGDRWPRSPPGSHEAVGPAQDKPVQLGLIIWGVFFLLTGGRC